MQKIERAIVKYLPFLIVASLLLSACASKSQTPTVQPVLPIKETPEIQKTQTPQLDSITPTPTATLLPIKQENASIANAGLIIFSMADGEYKHLFAYHPSYLAVTRLTSDAWDDDSPAVSPDGNKIAYTSTRSGSREIYILDLVSNTVIQMTNLGAFEGSICWSHDGNYIAYDVYQKGHYDLIVQSVNNQTEAPIQLTDGPSNSFQPSWSPDGSELAFVSDQAGRNEIWLARLQNPDERFVKVIGDADSDYSHPVWSPDGLTLAVDRHQTDDDILLIQLQNLDTSPVLVGKGKNPVWFPDGSAILVSLNLANQNELMAYAINDHHLVLPPIPMAGSLSSYDWKSGNLSQNIQTYLARNTIAQPDTLWVDQPYATSSETGRRSLVPLDGVNAPQASLSDAVDDSFNQLRKTVAQKVGWDFLGTLDNAILPATANSMPDIPENWLYTGRAFAANMAPYDAGWMVTTREEITGETFWRVWIKCKVQDGTCGQPIDTSVWNFNSRSTGKTPAYENGGEYEPAPAGYWVDFTELALRFGWERLSSLDNWRSYFQGIQFNTFVLRQGMTWKQALLDIYPPEQVDLIVGKNQ
jgi:TolB protein